MGWQSTFVSAISLIGGLVLTTGSLAQGGDDRVLSGKTPGGRGSTAARGVSGYDSNAARASRQGLSVDSRDIVGESGQRIPLGISIRGQTDITIESIKLLGLPAGYVLKDTLHAATADKTGENLDVTDWDIPGLWLEQPDRSSEQFWLSLILVWRWTSSESIEVSVTDFAVEVTPKPEARGLSKAAMPGPSHRDEAARTPVPITPPGDGAGHERGQDERARSAEVGSQVPAPSPPPPARATDTRSSVARARDLIGRGDLSGARLLLERGRARSEPDATFLLAQTWDPKMLRQWNVRGLRPDPERARALYDEAAKREPAEDRQRAATRR